MFRVARNGAGRAGTGWSNRSATWKSTKCRGQNGTRPAPDAGTGRGQQDRTGMQQSHEYMIAQMF
jgi:hypothetical protein